LIKNDSSVLSVAFEYQQANSTSSPEQVPAPRKAVKGAHIAVIGAGNFAQAYRLPYLKQQAKSLTTIVTRQGHHAAHLQKKWGFINADTDPARALCDDDAAGVLIATRHDNHAELAGLAMEAGKAVFVEKPLAMDADELSELWKRYQRFGGRLMVGYNRRFAPAAIAARRHLETSEPLLMQYRVNNTVLPASHWTADAVQGGGRVLGELCHFVDFFCFLADSVPVSVNAQALAGKNENLVVTVRLADGSIGTITHAVNGDLKLGKERIEAYSATRVAVIEDFNSLHLGGGSKSSTQKLAGKGHEECVVAFCRFLAGDSKLPISVDQLFLGALATVLIPEAVASGNKMDVSFSLLDQ
jgi:polar amino acid transport system substrate-binding protein